MIKRFVLKRSMPVVCLLTLILTSTHSPTVTANDDLLRLATSLCEAAKADDRSTMRKKLKSAKLRLRAIYDAISCGADGSILRVAILANAKEAATFVVAGIGEKGLAQPEPDGKTVVQWTEGLVAAGDASKQVFLDLFNSKLEDED